MIRLYHETDELFLGFVERLQALGIKNAELKLKDTILISHHIRRAANTETSTYIRFLKKFHKREHPK